MNDDRGFIYQAPDTCEIEMEDCSSGELGPCDRPCTGWCWYDGGEHEPMLTRACHLHETDGAEALAALVTERDDLAVSVARVEALHAPVDVFIQNECVSICDECSYDDDEPHPCPTIKALRGESE